MRGSPNVIMEAVACNVPLIITGALPGQEEENPKFVEKHKLGVVCESTGKIKDVVSYQIGGFIFDAQKQTLEFDGETKKLTTKESELLNLLAANANNILERNYALKTIWVDDNYFNARSMDVYITKLRKLLKDDPNVAIINIHGKGYKLIMPQIKED